MFARSLALLTSALVLPSTADAVTLAPHRAVYELSLSEQGGDFVGAEGRIAMELKSKDCDVYDLDYRFVAKFEQNEEITLTDQQTNSVENRAGTSFEFTTKTFVDGSPEKEIRGSAKHEGDSTVVAMAAPTKRTFDLPLSRFPMQHTAELIEKAEAGERIVESRLFDGDDDAQKLLSSTAIISPIDPAKAKPETEPAKSAGAAATAAMAPDLSKMLAGLRSWKVSESYYNADSDPDGMPVFETSYVLYENGVSDDLTLNFGTYALSGSLSALNLFDASACK